MYLRNVTGGEVVIEEFGMVIPADAIVDIEDTYCVKREDFRGHRIVPSALDDLCGGSKLKPLTEEELEGLLQVARPKSMGNKVLKTPAPTGHLPPALANMVKTGKAEGSK